MEVVVSTGAIRRAKLQLHRHHQQINTQLLSGQMHFLSPNQQLTKTYSGDGSINFHYRFDENCKNVLFSMHF